jgi:hypothetical protein
MLTSGVQDTAAPPAYSNEDPSLSIAIELPSRPSQPLQESEVRQTKAFRNALGDPKPLSSLTNAAALVDCPYCGECTMTRTETARGTTSQYVYLGCI